MTDKEQPSDGLLDSEELNRIRDSLTGTGFLLEHRVFETMQAQHLNTFLGALYTDPDTGLSREMDVTVRDPITTTGASVRVWASIVIECKNWKAPVVVIGKPREKLWRGREFAEAVMTGDPLVGRPYDAEPTVGSTPTFLRLRDLPASVESGGFMGNQMVLLERRGQSYKATNDTVHESVTVPLAKAMSYEQRMLMGAGPSERGNVGDISNPALVLSFPLLVTAGPVIEAEPGNDGVDVREVPWTRLVRTFRDSNLPGGIIIEVVQESAIDDWIRARLRPYLDQVLGRLTIADALLIASRNGKEPTSEMILEVMSYFT